MYSDKNQIKKRRRLWQNLLQLWFIAFLGTALMLFGTFVVDLVIPCEFPAEIKKGNVAVGSVMAGISVGIGIIIRAAVMSPSGTAVHESLLTGIASTIYYYVVG